MKVIADIKITYKNTIQDKKGLELASLIKEKGIDENPIINTGKFFTIEVKAKNRFLAKDKIDQICNSFLMDKDIEEYEIIKLVED